MSIKHRAAVYSELLRRYRDVFTYFWRQRLSLDAPELRAREAEFLPAALALQSRPVSPLGRGVAKILMLLVAVAIAWSVLGEIDIIVHAEGKIIPSARTKTIASVDVASVRSIAVQEGQFVQAGDVLIELDASAFDAEHAKASGDYLEALLQIARAEALIAGIDSGKLSKPRKSAVIPDDKWLDSLLQLDGEYRDFRAKLQRIDGDISHYSQALPLLTQQADDYRALAESHDVPAHAYLEKEQARLEMQGRWSDAKNQRAALIAETRKTAFDALTAGRKKAGEARQDAVRAGAHSQLLKLKAPVAGTVQQLTVHTVGGVVPAAQPLMQIVPEDSRIEVEALLENKDIGFVAEGQTTQIKIDAFPYTKYGTVGGVVSHVSRDAIEDEKRGLLYRVKVVLDAATLDVDGQAMPLTAGLSVQADIKTGTRRVIEYVLSPILQHSRESLRER
ncbi:MAG: HlyD family type I secretion periplasmic adaptor subunit [Methylomonas sp.]|jgi:hemolysin D